MECPVCKKDFDEKTGRRPKKFCSDGCKVKWWNAKKKVVVNNKPKNKERILYERSSTAQFDGKRINPLTIDEMAQWVEPTKNPEIQLQIDKLQEDIKNFGTNQLGQIMKNAALKKIENLKKELYKPLNGK